MSRTTSLRKYGKRTTKSRAYQVLTELPSPRAEQTEASISISDLTEKLNCVTLEAPTAKGQDDSPSRSDNMGKCCHGNGDEPQGHLHTADQSRWDDSINEEDLRCLTWADVCPPGDQIEKIAEASYAEVYRVSNERGTSIIKVIRLQSPIKPQTKTQARSGLVDEEPHAQGDLAGELRISEWLADIPGFVVYKERYVVSGRTTKQLLETHQAFHRRAKRQDPDRLQFYPSPSRYLDDTKFLVVELGDAGVALEDFEILDINQVWDIFLHVTIALARAEDQINFEVRAGGLRATGKRRSWLTSTASGSSRRQPLYKTNRGPEGAGRQV